METFKPSPEKFDLIQDEALQFNEAVDKGDITNEELKEFLTDPEIDPDLFIFNLRMKRYGDALLYLMSVPGTGCHMSNDKDTILTTLNRGGSISGQSGITDEFFMSFNVASTEGISGSAVEAPFSYQKYKNSNHIGVILKPQYLEKIADFSEGEEEIKAALERYVTRAKEDNPNESWRYEEFGELARKRLPGSLLNARKLIFSIQAKNTGENYENVEVQPNIGLRTGTMRGGELVAQPITPEDIACYFTIRPTNEKLGDSNEALDYIQFYRPDGQLFLREEINYLVQKAKEEKVIERYEEYERSRQNDNSLAS